jgi:hypothetical protein
MLAEHRSLLMRANRLLGASLVDSNLVKIEHLESANERLLELINSGEARQTTLLGILAYDMKVVREEDVLQHLVDEHSIGLIDLAHYEINEDLKRSLDPGPCWATWTVPFDREEDFHFLATAYYLSPAVRTYWQKQLGGNLVWYGTTLEGIAEHLEKITVEQPGASASS